MEGLLVRDVFAARCCREPTSRYHGQGLLGQLKGKRPSSVAQLRADQALRSLERASQCTGFPEEKRQRVEELQARARHIAFYLAQNQCPQS